MPSFANVPRPAAPSNAVAVADLFEVKTETSAAGRKEEVTHLGTFFRGLPSEPPKPPSPQIRVSQDSDEASREEARPVPVVRNFARSPRLRAIIGDEESRFVAQHMDSPGTVVAVFATNRLKIPVGTVTIEGGPSVKIFDPSSSARKIGVGLADAEVEAVSVRNQSQLDRLVKCLDGLVTLPGRKGLKLEAIVVPNDSHLDVPERHAHLITSLENYRPNSKPVELRAGRRENERELVGLGIEHPLSALSALVAPELDVSRTELKREARKERKAARSKRDLSTSEDPFESALAAVIDASLSLERPIVVRGRDDRQLPQAEDQGWTVFDKAISLAGRSEKRAPSNEKALEQAETNQTVKPIEAQGQNRLAAEVPAHILQISALPPVPKAAAQERTGAGERNVEAATESPVASAMAKIINAAPRAEMSGLVLNIDELEKLRQKFMEGLESNGGALGKIAAFALRNETEYQRAVMHKEAPSQEVLAWKKMHDDTINPQLRDELRQSLLGDVKGTTAIVFAPREAITPEIQAVISFLNLDDQPAKTKLAPRGQILNVGSALDSQEDRDGLEQLEAVA
jgi:hypothetical protein